MMRQQTKMFFCMWSLFFIGISTSKESPALEKQTSVEQSQIKKPSAPKNSGRPDKTTADRRLLVDSHASRLFRRNNEKLWLKRIQDRKLDKDYFGVIGSVTLPDGQEVTLERRNVATEAGTLPLVLNRIGTQYIYDGDIVVPPSAIVGATFLPDNPLPANVMFAAGMTGVFGSGTLWDDGIIPFEVETGFCCRTELTDAIDDFQNRTNFRFIPRNGHQDYIRFVNAFLTTSRTSIGKVPGENTIWISSGASAGTIQHEIGHRLNLIHEHLRSDRDLNIVRNPACVPGSVIPAIVDGWIDVSNETFINEAAELLTDYDFDSRMHYFFLLDNTGDGMADCSTWVRRNSCPGGDPASPSCNGNFSSSLLTSRDIEGLHKLYSGIPGFLEAINDSDTVLQFTGDNVRHNGRRIDKCLQGTNSVAEGCNGKNRQKEADEFCKIHGFNNSFNVQYEALWSTHLGFDIAGQEWVELWGTEVISSITCQHPVTTSTGNAADNNYYPVTGVPGSQCATDESWVPNPNPAGIPLGRCQETAGLTTCCRPSKMSPCLVGATDICPVGSICSTGGVCYEFDGPPGFNDFMP